MKTQVFADTLLAHSAAILLSGADNIGRELEALASALREVGGASTVATFLRKLSKRRREDASQQEYKHSPQGMLVSKVEPHIAALRTTLAAAGAKAAVSDLDAFVEFLSHYSSTSVPHVVSEIARLAVAPPKVKKKTPEKKIDAAVVRQLADKLTRANEVPGDFTNLIETMKADKSLSKTVLEHVANEFLGIQLKYKSKPDIFKKLEDRHYVDTLNNSRGRIIDRIAI
ncbi:MAG: hypothetical protein JXQ99_16295 [Hyphomicrobiaceae bacterium]